MDDLLIIFIILAGMGLFAWSYSAWYHSWKQDLRELGKDPDKEDGW